MSTIPIKSIFAVLCVVSAVGVGGLVVAWSRSKPVHDPWVSSNTSASYVSPGIEPLDTKRVEEQLLLGWLLDSVEVGQIESGDLLIAQKEKAAASLPAVELADIIAGKRPGRTSGTDITVFKSNGLAVEDVVVGGWVFQEASRRARIRRSDRP